MPELLTHPLFFSVGAGLDQPLLIGWLKPVILLPASLATGLPPSQLRAILAHELAHIKRHDYLFSSIQSIIETLLFFHPAVWWVSNQINIEREYCCDDLAVATLKNKKLYLQTLAGLESARIPNFSLSMKGGVLLSRVRRLAHPAPQTSTIMMNKSAFIAGFLLFIIACTGITACNDYSLTDQPSTALTSDIELPADLAQKINANDIEGTINQLHEIREAGNPDALAIAYAAFQKAADDDLRENLTFVFAHFNSFEADNVLVEIAKTDEDEMVRSHALRSISLRLDPDPRYLKLVDNSFYAQNATLYAYPKISREQLNVLYPNLEAIIQDESQYSLVRHTALNIMAREPENNTLLMDIYQKTADKKVRLAVVRNLTISPEQKLQMYATLYDASDPGDFRNTLIYRISETGVLQAAPLLMNVIYDAKKIDEASSLPVFALINLVHNLPKSTYPTVREMIEFDQLQNTDWGVFEPEIERLIKMLTE